MSAPTRRWALARTAQVIATRAAERILGDRRTDVPRAPLDLGAEWLTRALCHSTPGARVVAVERHGGSAGTTTRQALTLTYNQEGLAAALPTRLFVKCTATAAQRLMLGLGGLIDREPGFYRDVRPVLEIEAPVGYYGAVDHRTWRSIMLIEDVVATRGARFWNPSIRISRGELEDLVITMATWHGALWESDRLAQWGWLRTPAEQLQVIDRLIGLADRRSIGFVRAKPAIPLALHGRQPDLFEGMRRWMRHASERPHTYLHGDLHIANTYSTSTRGGGTGRLGVADWQVGLKGSWAHDYAYLLATGPEIDDRRAWERDLLEVYLQRLEAAGGPAIPRADAWLAYRRAALYPYFAWVYTIGRSRLQPRFQPDEVSLTMIGRIAAAIDDLDSLGAVGL